MLILVPNLSLSSAMVYPLFYSPISSFLVFRAFWKTALPDFSIRVLISCVNSLRVYNGRPREISNILFALVSY